MDDQKPESSPRGPEERYREWKEREWKSRMDEDFGSRPSYYDEASEERERRLRYKFDKRPKRWKNWWFTAFGPIGPFFNSIFGVVLLAFGIWVLKFLNETLGNLFIVSIITFLSLNLHWFFAAFLFFNYVDYIKHELGEVYKPLSPLLASVGVVIVVWIAGLAFNTFGFYYSSELLFRLSGILSNNLLAFFIIILVGGYGFLLIKKFFASREY